MTILTKKEREQLRKERIEAEKELEKYRMWESVINEHTQLAAEYEQTNSEYEKRDILERINELKQKEKEIKKELNIK
jgi:acetyl-CoA carboxylase alpha subunit